MRHIRPRPFLAMTIALFCIVHAPVPGQGAEDGSTKRDPELAALMVRLASVRRIEAKFTETKQMSVLAKPITTYGLLKYIAPSYLEKQVGDPVDERYVVDGEKVTVADTNKNRTKTFSLKRDIILWGFVESVRATLAGDIDTLERFYKIGFHRGKNWTMVLEPRTKRMKKVIKTIEISGSDNRITQIKTTDPSGDTSLMSITITDNQ